MALIVAVLGLYCRYLLLIFCHTGLLWRCFQSYRPADVDICGYQPIAFSFMPGHLVDFIEVDVDAGMQYT